MLWDEDDNRDVDDDEQVRSKLKSRSKQRRIRRSRPDSDDQEGKVAEPKPAPKPYPVTALADSTATPYTPFARSVPVPVTQAQFDVQESTVEALKRQADNPDAPTAQSMKHIKNKIVRRTKWEKERVDKKKKQRVERKKLKKERAVVKKNLVEKEGLTEEQAQAEIDKGKKIPRTTENMRIYDETLVVPDDEEVLRDLAQDELGSYFASAENVRPKILLTSSMRPSNKVKRTMTELAELIPNSKWYERGTFPIKMILEGALTRGFTDMILIQENNKRPHHLIHCHLPEGPTAFYRLTNLQLRKEIVGGGAPTKHSPELILNNFNTRLGHTLGRMFVSLFPKAPEFSGRRVVTFHNQRDFIFFRHHRYVFDSPEQARLQECGPRFTLKLEKLQHNLFDPLHEEYIWIKKPREQGKQKRHQHL